MNHLSEQINEHISHDPLNFIQPQDAILPEYAGIQIFEEPIFAIGSPNDPLFLGLKDETVIGEHVILPTEWLPSAKSVISFFFPFADPIVASNAKTHDLPSNLWLHGRIEGQNFIGAMGRLAAESLKNQGFETICPGQTDCFQAIYQPENNRFTSNWSERHVAYICGLGTFGLSKGIITQKGMAGRFISIVTEADFPKTTRAYHDLYEYCTKCGSCIRQCPVHAISLEKGKEHAPCYQMLQESKKISPSRLGCGKCQVNVPCSRQIP